MASQDALVARGLAAILIAVTNVGTSLVVLMIAAMVPHCSDGCAVGSPWASGGSANMLEAWGLAVPAVLVASLLVCSVATGHRCASIVLWIIGEGLLIAWTLFVGLGAATFDSPSPFGSWWLWPVGLLASGGAGLLGVAMTYA